MSKFGEFISNKRMKMGFSARKLAQLLDTSSSYLCDIEQGRKFPPFTDEKNEFYQGLIRYLGLTPEEISQMYKCVDEDLAQKGVISPDIVEYVNSSNESRIAFRTIKELNPTADELQEALDFLRDKVKKERLFISDRDLDLKAMNLLKEKYPQYLDMPYPVDIENIIETSGYSLQSVVFKERSILGAAVFNPQYIEVVDPITFAPENIFIDGNTILFDEYEASKQEHRFRMTLAHEFAHMVLHKEMYSKESGTVLCRQDQILMNSSNIRTLVTKRDWEEHQANYFASCLLIPKTMLLYVLIEASMNYEIPNIKKLKFISDKERELIINKLSVIFDVSKQMASIRLNKFLIENS